jgi:hypothetical protein
MTISSMPYSSLINSFFLHNNFLIMVKRLLVRIIVEVLSSLSKSVVKAYQETAKSTTSFKL